jgi:hypothetical protein
VNKVVRTVPRASESYLQRERPGDRAVALFGLPVSVPLVLDLDGTLIAGDFLYKALVRPSFEIRWSCFNARLGCCTAAPRWSANSHCGPASTGTGLSCIGTWWSWQSAKKTAGRAIVLATAAAAVLAGQLASRLGFIDHVLASDGQQNFKGSAKAEMLSRLFPAGFIYAGDSKADLRVWRQARGIILVNARSSVPNQPAR